ncbi:MAG: SDR family oxidoreductase [bacterium]|jgi:UDP-glucose 4-epimerase
MAKFLITGGAGFIGSNIARRVVSEGGDVVILDDFSTGYEANLTDIKGDATVIKGDICDTDTVKKAMKGVDYVHHHAAVVSVVRSVDDPLRTDAVNIGGTLNLLVAARDAGVKRFVFAGSSSAYGDNPTLPKQEDMKAEPLSPYAVSKLAGEMYVKVFNDVYGLPAVTLRYFNIFGPYQDPTSQYAAVIPIFINKLARGESPVVYGDGEQSRDFTYIDNAVQANLLAATAERAPGTVINVACGERFTLNELLTRLHGLVGKDVPATYEAARPGDVKHSLGDITRAREVLGYEPLVTFEDGLKATVAWFLPKA